MCARFLGAIEAGAPAATSYYALDGSASAEIAPLGASLEAGWASNVFGGPCFVASGDALDVVRGAVRAPFQFWPAYAAMACADRDLAVIPEPLYTAQRLDDCFAARESVVEVYRTCAPERLDLGWVLKHAQAKESTGAASVQEVTGSSVGRAIYDRLIETPDSQLSALAALQWTPVDDPYVRDLRRLRARLGALAREWQATCPRVFVYGAGQHARLLLALEPELGPYIAGFIDRRPLESFLGKPCVRPEALSPSDADVVLYSSREYEREMHARIATVNVQHVLLYTDSPAVDAETTSTRIRRRLGHDSAPIDAVRAMYRPPAWVRGGCSGGDVEFLLEMVMGVQPHLVLELGVASGTSSAALLFALDQLPASATGRMLHSCDVRATCYFDASRSTGAAVADLYPHHRAAWHLDTDSDARRVRMSLPDGSVDLCFIDANHCHPWPLLDLLHVAPLVRPEGWVVLHDIELPRLHPQFQVHGPLWLFEAWPFNKIHGVAGSVNIGAVQLPRQLADLVPIARALLERGWEHAPTTWDIDLPHCFDDIMRLVTPRLMTAAPTAASR
jgi:predicted O-methyltransferase YrrM